ncbi:Gfo/Idh/MocA family protein [Rhodohalobacter sp. 8-1]|uniref:Gfo/Idh/MocA family protein n=1 Tax=Rhodohalobacter sp. 8-1 TaxID=3131972 RepID=UPI0030EEA15D
MKSIKWGIISTAKIGVKYLIPAIQASDTGTVYAIASRDLAKAEKAAEELNIPVSHGSYEELLADDKIDAIYNPLPNHLHVPWTIKALEAGKHVLCEKPVALDSKEAESLLQKTKEFPDLKVMEAFMYRFHPQWTVARNMVKNHEIGAIQSIQSVFSYYNDDPENIRNRPNMGGGGLMDIGCYCISLSRIIFGKEPDSVYGEIDIDPNFGVDRKASGILTFGDRTATFTCSTQMQNYQRVLIFGTDGMIEIVIPFNTPADKPVNFYLTKNGNRETHEIPAVDQYKLQADAFCRSIINNTAVPTPLEDAVANMKVIDAVFESGKSGKVVEL